MLLFSLSLLLYPAGLSLPLALILAEGGRGTGAARPYSAEACRGALHKYAGWLVVVLLVGALNLFAAATPHTGFTPIAGASGYPLWSRAQHLVAMTGHYTGRIFWPGDTAIFYGTSAQLSQFASQRYLALGVLALAIVLLAGKRTRRATALFLALAAASLLPFVGLLDQDQVVSDRYAFLALAVIAAGLAHLISQITSRSGQVAMTAGLITLMVPTSLAYRAALAAWRDTDSVQARLESATAMHPNARLSFARPAITDFLRGRFEQSRGRLAAGEIIFGRHPELTAAGQYIDNVKASLGFVDGLDPPVAPYALLHLRLAKEHRARGHARAAEIHTIFAYRLGSASSARP
ncbi:MAG: hypothetical protein EXS42_08290 [Lacunisphaera sp.]|nr:hypothetical protein [Lacunisphaera sp.]